MIAKLVTIPYLVSLATTAWIVFRNEIRLDDLIRVKKILSLLLGGYGLALTYIFIACYHWEKPLLYLAMLGFCPFVLFGIFFIFKKYEYQGDFGVLILAITLNSIGLIMIYRLDINSGLGLFKIFGFQDNVPMAFKQLVFSVIAFLGVVFAIAKGLFSIFLDNVEKNTSFLFWGIFALIVVLISFLCGDSQTSQDKSGQVTEIIFKLFFLFLISLYYKSHAPELATAHYPLKDVTKLVLFIFICVALFVLLPFCFLKRELGTTLLTALTFLILTTYVTNRVSFFILGIAMIAFIIFLGTIVSDHIAGRVLATWLDWKEYAFKPFGAGTKYPGYQIFTAIAAIKLSPWGVGIGNGILKHASMVDKTIVPMAVNDFIIIPSVSELGIGVLLIIGSAFFVLVNKAIPKMDHLTFRAILAVGITIALATQALYNLSSVIALLPPTGVPLPWVSYGGSATLANYCLIGLLCTILNERNIAREKK